MKKVQINKKPSVGVFGISGCAGCLLTLLYEDCFKEVIELVDIKSFPLIKEDNYNGNFDYVFIEGTVCFNRDVKLIKELRKRAENIVALGCCSHLGGVPSIKNFKNSEKTMRFVYPKYNHLKSTDPEPIDRYIRVDYYLPQCPPSKKEVVDFVKCVVTGRKFKNYSDSVCLECRRKGNYCLLDKGEICLGPLTNGGCMALCPTNDTECYGCRGPCKDANVDSYLKMLKKMGHTKKEMYDKMNTFAGMQFKEKEGGNISEWLES